MDVFKLSRNWFDFAFENPEKITPNHAAIYFFAIEHCNRLGWKNKFGFPSQMAMDAVGIKNWRTFMKAFNDLVEWKFIILIEKSKNQYSANVIAIAENTKANTKALDKALQKHSQKQYNCIASIDIQETNKQETNKQELENEFEKFWNLYDKKVGEKSKLFKKWQNLTSDEKNKIFEYIPKYKNSITDKKFRKNPETFLNNKSWNDEIINIGMQQNNSITQPAKKPMTIERYKELFSQYQP